MTIKTLTRILYVEDDPDIQAVVRLSLESLGGFTVYVSNSGSEALQAAPEFAPELILLDVMMPDMDGPTTIRALRELPGMAEIPFVFLTAKTQPADTARYLGLGALGVIPKPFDPTELPQTLLDLWKGGEGEKL